MGRSPAALDPEAIGREAAERSTSLLGASQPASRTCPVVLDETVAASFVGFIGGVLCADAVQRGRSPFAENLGEEIASQALTIADDGADPAGLNSSPFDGEGTPTGRTALIEAGELRAFLHDSYTARREGDGTRSTANAARSGYRSPPSVSPSNLTVAAGELSFAELLAEAGDGIYVTDVAGLHSGVNPVSGNFSVGATGRADLRRGARRARRRVHDRLRPDGDAGRGPRRRLGGALGPVRRLGPHPRSADRRDGDRGRLKAGCARKLIFSACAAATDEELWRATP